MLDKEQLKKDMLNLVEKEKQDFQQRLHAYQETDSPSIEAYAELNAALVSALERIIALYHENEGHDSLFLKNTMKPLVEALEDAKATRERILGEHDRVSNPDKPLEDLPDDAMRVYIVLYHIDGANLANWVVQLLSLEKLLATRPVYANEADARQASRTGTVDMSKGYASVVVKKNMLIEDEHSAKRKDPYGRQMLLLKEGALADSDAIEYLVIGNQRYRWLDKQLLPMQAI